MDTTMDVAAEIFYLEPAGSGNGDSEDGSPQGG